MSITRSKRPEERVGKKTDPASTRQTGKKQNAEELNRNEEKVSPVSGSNHHQASGQMRHNVARSENQDRMADQWNQGRHQTTGSNVPGAEIKDRTSNQNQDPLDLSSQSKNPSDASGMDRSKTSNPQQWKQPMSGYTGNSERSGQQYSVEENSSQRQELDKTIDKQRRNTPGMKNDQGKKEDRDRGRGHI